MNDISFLTCSDILTLRSVGNVDSQQQPSDIFGFGRKHEFEFKPKTNELHKRHQSKK